MIYLDAAEDFVAKARRFYPPRDEDDEEEDKAINLPLLLSRVNQCLNAGEEDDEDDEDDE